MKDLTKLVKAQGTFLGAGPSGWTAELLLPLLSDETCLKGITLLVQLIANNTLDDHSRTLLTCSLLHAIPKKDNDLRPLALGELFVKLACKYCFNLDAPGFPDIFEPIQLAVCCPGGSERAIMTVQAKTELNPTGFMTIFVDASNAYNTADRALMLESVYSDRRLSHLWRAYSFCYSQASQLLLRQHGVVIDTIASAQGGRQGCVLAGLGYAHLFQPAYEACIDGLPNTMARAIMDDLAITGPPAEAFAAYASFKAAAVARGVNVNLIKTCAVQADGILSDGTLALAVANGFHASNVKVGNHEYVGGYIGVDDAAGRAFLVAKLNKQQNIARAIRDSDFPLHLALNVAKTHALPRPTFYFRSLPYRVSREPLEDFDGDVQASLMRRCNLSHELPPSALLSLTQPVGNCGLGLRSLAQVRPAGKWSASVSVAADVQSFADAADSPLPFMLDREAAFADLVAAGARVADPTVDSYYDIKIDEEEKKAWGPYVDARLQFLPSSADRIIFYYCGERTIHSLQFMLSRSVANAALDRFLAGDECTVSDRIRLTSCRAKESGLWLQLHPLSLPMPDPLFRIALRLRLGLPPCAKDLPSPCPLCGKGVGVDGTPDAWHPFACSSVRRRMVTTRHDRGMELLCRFARSCSVIASLEPKDFKSLVPDGEFFFSGFSALGDLSGVHPTAPSHLHASPQPGKAAERRAAAKDAKYASHAESVGSSFSAFVVDSFGCMHKHFTKFLDRIEEEASLAPFLASPGRLSRDDFLSLFAAQWQSDNARIVLQWLRMCRKRMHGSLLH